MKRKTSPPDVTEAEIRALLDRYHCPVPYHAVRMRFLGNIATPSVGIAPIDMIKRLWGGECRPSTRWMTSTGFLRS